MVEVYGTQKRTVLQKVPAKIPIAIIQLSSYTFGIICFGAWTLTAARERELQTTRRKMLRKMIGTVRRLGEANREQGGEGSNDIESVEQFQFTESKLKRLGISTST